MKHSKLKEVLLIKDKVYLYIAPEDIYLRIDKIEQHSGIKVHRIVSLPIIQLLRNFYKKIKGHVYLLDIKDVYEGVSKNSKNKNNKNNKSN